MRLHGDQEPKQPQQGTTGGAACTSGAANEVWSYGETVYGICKKYMMLREQLRDYTRELMRQAHEKGSSVMRTLFYEFPEVENAGKWLTNICMTISICALQCCIRD
jgi:alpha-D-xyloside xylohydrolase